MIHLKDINNLINWIEKVSDPNIYRISYLHCTINMDYIQGAAEYIKQGNFQEALTLLWISYTLTKDNNILTQIQSLFNGYANIYGVEMYDHIKDHNTKIKYLVNELKLLNTPVEYTLPNIYPQERSRDTHYWKKNNVEFLKRTQFHGLYPFPRISKPYSVVKMI